MKSITLEFLLALKHILLNLIRICMVPLEICEILTDGQTDGWTVGTI